MKITQVSAALKDAFGSPQLTALIPNESNYSVMLMQPRGQIEATDGVGVRNRDRDLARRQFGAFLEEAQRVQADLAITPEYSMPWEVLTNALKAGIVPGPGKLWVLGCESIRYSELGVLKRELAETATLIYEPLEDDEARFTDPLVYIFYAPVARSEGAIGLVVLIQFKTFPMGDKDHFEANCLQRGTRVYVFGDGATSIKLVSLICSDVFEFLDAEALAVYDRALVIHIQLYRAS